MTEPTPYNFGGEPSRPIRNRHIPEPKPAKRKAWNKGVNYTHGVTATPLMVEYGIHKMKPGEYKTIEFTDRYLCKSRYTALVAMSRRENGAILVSRSGDTLSIKCVKKIDRVEE